MTRELSDAVISKYSRNKGDNCVQFGSSALDDIRSNEKTGKLLKTGKTVQKCNGNVNGDMIFALSDNDEDFVDSVRHQSISSDAHFDMITSTSEISDSSLALVHKHLANGKRLNQKTRKDDDDTTTLRRSPSQCSLRTATIARLIDTDGLTRRMCDVQQDKLRAMRRAYQVCM